MAIIFVRRCPLDESGKEVIIANLNSYTGRMIQRDGDGMVIGRLLLKGPVESALLVWADTLVCLAVGILNYADENNLC